MALAHNLDIQVERCAPALGRYALQSAYRAYDPVLQLTAQRSFKFVPLDYNPTGKGVDYPYDAATDAWGPGLAGRLPTGARYGLTYRAEFADFTSYLDRYDLFPTGIRHTNEWIGSAALTLRQPLLKDLWTDRARLSIALRRQDLKMAEQALRRRIMQTIAQVEVAYYELIRAREQVVVAEKGLELAQQLLAECRRQVEAGVLPPLSEKLAEARAATREADLITARQDRDAQQNALKLLLTDDFRSWAGVNLQPGALPQVTPTEYRREESWQNAMRLRPDLQEARLELQKRKSESKFCHNQLFPRLDLVGNYGSRSVRDSFSGAMGEVGRLDGPAYSLGVVLSLPLSNRSAREEYHASRARNSQSLLQLQKREQDALAEVEVAGRRTQTTYERLNAAQRARDAAELAVAFERDKLAAGESTFFIVLRLELRLTEARSAELRARVDHHQALAQLALSEGSILERHGVQLELK